MPSDFEWDLKASCCLKELNLKTLNFPAMSVYNPFDFGANLTIVLPSFMYLINQIHDFIKYVMQFSATDTCNVTSPMIRHVGSIWIIIWEASESTFALFSTRKIYTPILTVESCGLRFLYFPNDSRNTKLTKNYVSHFWDWFDRPWLVGIRDWSRER